MLQIYVIPQGDASRSDAGGRVLERLVCVAWSASDFARHLFLSPPLRLLRLTIQASPQRTRTGTDGPLACENGAVGTVVPKAVVPAAEALSLDCSQTKSESESKGVFAPKGKIDRRLPWGYRGAITEARTKNSAPKHNIRTSDHPPRAVLPRSSRPPSRAPRRPPPPVPSSPSSPGASRSCTAHTCRAWSRP